MVWGGGDNKSKRILLAKSSGQVGRVTVITAVSVVSVPLGFPLPPAPPDLE